MNRAEHSKWGLLNLVGHINWLAAGRSAWMDISSVGKNVGKSMEELDPLLQMRAADIPEVKQLYLLDYLLISKYPCTNTGPVFTPSWKAVL